MGAGLKISFLPSLSMDQRDGEEGRDDRRTLGVKRQGSPMAFACLEIASVPNIWQLVRMLLPFCFLLCLAFVRETRIYH